jgi:hypothetical protein
VKDPCRDEAGWPGGEVPSYQGLAKGARCRAELVAIMKDVARALGVGCEHCHVADFSAPTRNKQVANWMATELMPSLEKRGGGAISCADCHASNGPPRAKILGAPRRRDLAVEWMTVVLVERFAAASGEPLYCRTCHGAGLGEAGFRGSVILAHPLTPAPPAFSLPDG